jgi:hypothetical protein
VIQHFRRHFGDKTVNNSTSRSELVIQVQSTVNSSYTEESYTQKVTPTSDLLSRALEQRTEYLDLKTTLGNVVHSSERLASDSGGGITVSQGTMGSTSDKSASEKSNTEKSSFKKSTAAQNTKMDLKQDRLSALENPAIKKILYFNKVSQKRDVFLRIFMPFLLFQSLRRLHEFYMYYY